MIAPAYYWRRGSGSALRRVNLEVNMVVVAAYRPAQTFGNQFRIVEKHLAYEWLRSQRLQHCPRGLPVVMRVGYRHSANPAVSAR